MGESGSFKTDLQELRRKLGENKKQIRIYVIVGLVLCPFLTGLLWQLIIGPLTDEPVVLADCFSIGLSGLGLVFTLALYAAWLTAGYRSYMTFYHDYKLDDDGDFQVYKSGEYGRGHFQTKEEMKKNLNCSKNPYELKGDILGTDEEGNLYTVDDSIKGMNRNVAIFGSSGAGKSAAWVIPAIYQNIIRGHSMIVTDSKGDLYKDTCYLAIKYGYVMRVLNLKSSELKNSDGVDLLKMLKDAEDADAKAEVLANVIIENSGDGHMDYFAINEMNLLKAIILLVIKPDYVLRGKDNLAEVYNICSHNSPDSLRTLFNMLDADDPAKEAFSIYDQCEPKVKGQILNGMAIRLNKLSNPYLKKVVSTDEIDMLLPMNKKCIYYVVISDMDRAYKFIATLFFSELFIILSEYADGMTTEERKKRIPVNFILDEYKNTGSIPDMDQKVSTIRSRDITTTIILQDVGQLKYMYPDLWETILNNMSVKILLKTGDDTTAEWFSRKLGTKTIRNVNKGEKRSSMEVLEGYDSYSSTSGKGKREVMTAAELMNELSENELIVLLASRHPIRLKKFLDFQHPMHKEAKEREMLAKHHLPKWRKKMQEEQEKREQEEALMKDSPVDKAAVKEMMQAEAEEKKPVKAEPASPYPVTESTDQERVYGESRPRKKAEKQKKKETKKPVSEPSTSFEAPPPQEDLKELQAGWASQWALDAECDEVDEKERNNSDSVLEDLFG